MTGRQACHRVFTPLTTVANLATRFPMQVRCPYFFFVALRDRFPDAGILVPSLRDFAGRDAVSSDVSCGNDVEDVFALELEEPVDNPGTNIGTKFFVLHRIFHFGYHAARNKFERFRGCLELISRFEFEFCRCEIFCFEGFEFLVCSCECAVACLCPRNSISNVVASLTIDDNIYIYIYVRCIFM